MSRVEKLKANLLACAGEFPFKDFNRLLGQLGYSKLATGKSGGSRRKYIKTETGHLIVLHEPHDGVLGPDTTRNLRQSLKDAGEI